MNSFPGKLPPIRLHAEFKYICVTDMIRCINEGDLLFSNWMSAYPTIDFFRAWDERNNLSYTPAGYEKLLREAGSNTFVLDPDELFNATHTIGLISRRSPGSVLYLHPEWALHFANWLSPAFYVDTLDILCRAKTDEDFVPLPLLQRLRHLLITLKN